MVDIVLIGGGGHASVVHSLLSRLGTPPGGYVATADAGPLGGVPWIGGDEAILDRDPEETRLALGIGQIRIEGSRQRVVAPYRDRGFRFLTVVSPAATVNDPEAVGEGTVVCDGAVVGPRARIGEFCVVNTLASVDHDCRLEDFVMVSPGATLCGSVEVGRGSIVGPGAVVVEGRRIGPDVLIGAGAAVTEDCAAPGVYLGTPARRRP